jgi:Domain of unknown function (DUF4177)
MNNYKFLRIKVTYSSGKIDSSSYEQAIAEHAAQGWDFVQIFVLIFKQPSAT